MYQFSLHQFHNVRTAIPIWQALEPLNHAQPPTPIKADNSTANDFVNKNLKQKRSKSRDMRYHWLRDRINQKHFNVFWDKGSNNYADYFTKHHSAKHHKVMRSKYIHMINLIRKLIKCEHNLVTSHGRRGCVELMASTSHNSNGHRHPTHDDVTHGHVRRTLVS